MPPPPLPLPASAYTFIFFVIAVVALRFCARNLSKSKIGLDDILVIPAAVTCIGLCILGLVAIHVGFIGRHIPAINPDLSVVGFKALVGFVWLQSFSITFAKMSILLFLLRIFPTMVFKRIVYLLMFVVCGLCFASIFVITFQCKPIAYAWDKRIKGGTCINQVAYFRYSTIPNVATDVAMLIIPLPMVWNLQTSMAQKAGLTAVFLTGSVGIVAACVRMIVYFKGNGFEDESWNAVDWITWSIIEAGIYILAACLPSFRILFAGLILPWARTFGAYVKRRNTDGRTSRLSNGSDKKPFSMLEDLGEADTVSSAGRINHSAQAEWSGMEREGISLDAIHVNRDFDVNYSR